MTTYAEKLRDPRWQKKRLEIFQRDEFKCQACQRKDQTLAVHHRWYERGLEPWDHSDASLVTLCEECHGQERARRPDVDRVLIETLRHYGFLTDDIECLTEVILLGFLVIEPGAGNDGRPYYPGLRRAFDIAAEKVREEIGGEACELAS